MTSPPAYRISVVVPVYQGERTLEGLVAEIEPLTAAQATPAGRSYVVSEVLLVHDGAVDDSHVVMQSLAERHAFVSPLWLSRNYGQHPATLAGMASTSGDFVVTLDEDGQHDPRDIARMLDRALDTGAQLVYAQPTNPPPHGALRNAASAFAKWAFVTFLGNRDIGRFHSFRLVSGEIARSLAAYCGHGVFLDVALNWVVGRSERCPVVLRGERKRPSGYTFGKLLSHFWRLILTSGTRPLRLIALLGSLSILVGLGITIYVLYQKFTHQIPVQGWTSLIIVICFFSGVILFSLGIIAEYLGVTVTMAMGKPLYLIVSKPTRKPPPEP
jgi:undecaprenyl-phosphate 4-deoxy-4-formamido-L-arabinose transferase